MKRVKKCKADAKVAHAVQKVIRNSCNKVIKAVKKASNEKMRDGGKSAKKQSKKRRKNRKSPNTMLYICYPFSDKMSKNQKQRPYIKIANPPRAKAVNKAFHKNENNNSIDNFRT